MEGRCSELKGVPRDTNQELICPAVTTQETTVDLAGSEIFMDVRAVCIPHLIQCPRRGNLLFWGVTLMCHSP